MASSSHLPSFSSIACLHAPCKTKKISAYNKIFFIRMKVTRVFTHHEFPREAAELYLEHDLIAVGFVYDADVADYGDRTKIKDLMQNRYPYMSKNQISNAAGQFLRFRDEIDVGNIVLAYEGENIVSSVGIVTSPCLYKDENKIGDPNGDINYPNQRKVNWRKTPRFFPRWKLIPELISNERIV